MLNTVDLLFLSSFRDLSREEMAEKKNRSYG